MSCVIWRPVIGPIDNPASAAVSSWLPSSFWSAIFTSLFASLRIPFGLPIALSLDSFWVGGLGSGCADFGPFRLVRSRLVLRGRRPLCLCLVLRAWKFCCGGFHGRSNTRLWIVTSQCPASIVGSSTYSILVTRTRTSTYYNCCYLIVIEIWLKSWGRGGVLFEIIALKEPGSWGRIFGASELWAFDTILGFVTIWALRHRRYPGLFSGRDP